MWLAFEGDRKREGSVRGRRLKEVGVTCVVSA